MEVLGSVKTLPLIITMLAGCLVQVLGFLKRVAPILIQHATLGLHTLGAYLNIVYPNDDEILTSIYPHLVTLFFYLHREAK